MISSVITLPAPIIDKPITDKVPKKYMLNLIKNLEKKVEEGDIDGLTALKVLEQAVKDYDDSNKVVSIFSKPKKEEKRA